MRKSLVIVSLLGLCQSVQAAMYITEFMYSGYTDADSKVSEFIEFTNTGTTVIDMTGWSFNDDHRLVSPLDLSAFGLVQPGESVIIAEGSADAFRTAWGLDASIKVIGGNTKNLGRADEINLYDDALSLVDRLTYDDAGSGTVKGPRARYFSANAPDASALGANNYSLWLLSSDSDAYGSHTTSANDVANPGICTVPEPVSAGFLMLGCLVLLTKRRR